MKCISISVAVMTFIVLTACSKQELPGDVVAEQLESATAPVNYQINRDDNKGIADFTIDHKDNTILEQEVLAITDHSVNAVSYKWDFGNGDTSTKANPKYEYKIHGYYTVTLTITDVNNKTHQASQDVLVLCIFGGGSHDK